MRTRAYQIFGIILAVVAVTSFQNCSRLMPNAFHTEQSSTSNDLRLQALGSLSVDAAFKIADSSDSRIDYAYAPTIIFAEGQYHAYYCSQGTGAVDWDRVRHVTSPDMVHWSAPNVVLASTSFERANCDPSVVRFNAGDGEYYYMMYSGNVTFIQTLNFVARSASPNGPFLKLTQRGTWESSPRDSKGIIGPAQPGTDSKVYGAGQASLVVKNGVVYQWYTDTSVPGLEGNRIYMVTSRDMINWSARQTTNVQNASVDVKYDAAHDQFVMFAIHNSHGQDATLEIATSQDGVTFTEPRTIADTNHFPHYANNIGASGDDQGHLKLDNGRMIVGYGAPYDLDPGYTNEKDWGKWDVYGNVINFAEVAPPPVVPPIVTEPEPPMVQPEGPTAPPLQNAATSPVQRFYQPQTGEHFFTMSFEEGIGAGFRSEGAPFQVLTDRVDNSHAIYRCLIPSIVMHFVSGDPNCEGQIVEGRYGFVHDGPGEGRRALYRLYHPAGDHLASTDPNEGVSGGYRLEGVLGYVN